MTQASATMEQVCEQLASAFQKVASNQGAPGPDRQSIEQVREHLSESCAEDWAQNPYVQIEGGFLAGVSLGLVPMGGVGHQLADAGEVLPHGTPEARLGLSVGMIVGGMAWTTIMPRPASPRRARCALPG